MIDQKEGETEFTVKVHYDDLVSFFFFKRYVKNKKLFIMAILILMCDFLQKRVSIRRHKYFYKPIDGTPFSLGIALPEGYGMFEFRAEEEIKHSYFNGELYIIYIKRRFQFFAHHLLMTSILSLFVPQ